MKIIKENIRGKLFEFNKEIILGPPVINKHTKTTTKQNIF